jgi:hypothetical protein
MAPRLLGWLLVLLAYSSPGLAADAWLLWQKPEGPVGGRFRDTWTPLGSYESQRECLAARREILMALRRKHAVKSDADAVTVEGSQGWRLTYTCLPGGVTPR